MERIDPVRYISNDSSGKMGFALARAARAMGAEVTLIAARTDEKPPQDPDIKVVRVESAQEMYEAVVSTVEGMRYSDQGRCCSRLPS